MYLSNQEGAFFLDSLGKVFDSMERTNGSLPEWIIQDLPLLSPLFSLPIQQDAHELLIILLDHLDKECQNSLIESGPSFITQYFSGISKTILSCPQCGESTKLNTFYDITIPINPEISVTESILQLLTENEVIQEVHCSKCMKKRNLN